MIFKCPVCLQELKARKRTQKTFAKYWGFDCFGCGTMVYIEKIYTSGDYNLSNGKGHSDVKQAILEEF